jgi:hypothetical protein
MLRFHDGEQVLVHRVRDERFDPPPRATVTRVYLPGESFLYNYIIHFANRDVQVKDDWLASVDWTIQESPELMDLL